MKAMTRDQLANPLQANGQTNEKENLLRLPSF